MEEKIIKWLEPLKESGTTGERIRFFKLNKRINLKDIGRFFSRAESFFYSQKKSILKSIREKKIKSALGKYREYQSLIYGAIVLEVVGDEPMDFEELMKLKECAKEIKFERWKRQKKGAKNED